MSDGPLTTLMLFTAGWLLVGSWVIGYQLDDATGAARFQEVGAALVVLGVAAAKLSGRQGLGLDAIVAAAGAWLIAAPFVFGYHDEAQADAARLNDIVCGAILLALAATSLAMNARARRRRQ